MDGNRVAVVTGAGTGIGAEAARLLARNGLDLVLVGRRREPLETVGADLEGRAVVVSADLGDPAAPARIVEQALAAFGRLDVVVNNAAVIQNGPLDSFSRAVFENHYAVNVAGRSSCCRRRCPRCAPPGRGGGQRELVGRFDRQAGEHALRLLEGGARVPHPGRAYELAADRIRVNCIAPGPVDTPIHATYSDDLEATYADLARRIPLQRMGQPADLAAWVWFLVSPDSAWTTGNVIHVDGGQVLGSPEEAPA